MPTTSMTADNVDHGGLSYGRVNRLSDDELLASTRGLVGKSNQILAALLAHLAEVETRGLYRTKACSSLYTYCIYELRFSEDAASRRVCAARFVKRFPLLLAAVANGELHLTGLLMLGPHITTQNQFELLARAKFRTKKELARLVRILDPLPDVPAQIVALGPAMPEKTRPVWQAFADSLCPVRHLSPGDRPGDWVADAVVEDGLASEPLEADSAAQAREARPCLETAALAREVSPCLDSAALAREVSPGLDSAALAREASPCAEGAAQAREASPCAEGAALAREVSPCAEGAAQARDASPCVEGAALAREASPCAESTEQTWKVSPCIESAALADEASPCLDSAALARGEMPGMLGASQRYQVQFTAGQEYVQLVERAKALLPKAASGVSGLADIHLRALRMLVAALEKQKYGAARTSPREAGAGPTDGAGGPRAAEQLPSLAERGRHIPAAERRAAFERDGARCSYVDARGERCRETSGLELHHLVPFARGGAHVSANLALFCRAHNTLAAEEDFGRGFVEAKRDQVAHEPWASQQRR